MKTQRFFGQVLVLVLLATLSKVDAYDAAGNTSGQSSSASATTLASTGNTIYAASCSQTDVQAAIDSASDGDTVIVPAGSCTWGSTFTITKGINLIGAGKTNTLITLSGNPGIYYNPDYSTDYPFRLSGFTFTGCASNGVMVLGNSKFRVNPPTTRKQTKVRIDHNQFESTCTAGPVIWNHQGVLGVIDNNVLFNTGAGTQYIFRNTHGYSEEAWTYWGYWPGMEANTQTGHGDNL